MRPDTFDSQCTAKSKRSGQRCRNYACRGRSTCRMHGGRCKRGEDHPNYAHGRYSKEMKEASELFDRLWNRPLEVRFVIFPESLDERMERLANGQRPRYDASVEMPSGFASMPLREQLNVLREAKKKLNARLSEVYQAIRRGNVPN
jgi:hypothetical protein